MITKQEQTAPTISALHTSDLNEHFEVPGLYKWYSALVLGSATSGPKQRSSGPTEDFFINDNKQQTNMWDLLNFS